MKLIRPRDWLKQIRERSFLISQFKMFQRSQVNTANK